MTSQRNRNNSQVIGGIVLIAIGTLFLLDRFLFFDFGYMVSRFWPTFLIVIGVMQLARGRARSWVGPLTLIVIGVIFQGQRLHLFNWSWNRLWPLMLIGIGFALLIDRLRAVGNPPSVVLPPPPGSGDSPQQRF